jgi:hypothetical protein
MEKLIVVGMRFCDAKVIEQVKQAAKSSTVVVTLRPEANTNGVDCKALAVYFKDTRVGYVRNTDLPLALHKHQYYTYTIRQCQAHYWIIDCKPLTVTSTKPSDYVAFATSGVTSGIQPPMYDGAVSNVTLSKFYPNENTVKDEKKMINTNSMRDSFFREVKNVAIDIQSGKFGVVTNEGISVYADGGVSVNPITDFGVKVPAFAMRVAINDLKAGDIIVGGSEPTFFVGLVKDGGYEVVTMNGEHKVIGTVTNMFFGKNTVLAVKNMFGEGVNPMMMAMMMGDKNEGFDMKTFALMSMMGNTTGKEGGMDSNMLMMMMLMGK